MYTVGQHLNELKGGESGADELHNYGVCTHSQLRGFDKHVIIIIMYIYIYVCIYKFIFLYIWRGTKREREREMSKWVGER